MTYTAMLSDSDSAEFLARALAAGANDCLMTASSDEELLTHLRAGIRVARVRGSLFRNC